MIILRRFCFLKKSKRTSEPLAPLLVSQEQPPPLHEPALVTLVVLFAHSMLGGYEVYLVPSLQRNSNSSYEAVKSRIAEEGGKLVTEPLARPKCFNVLDEFAGEPFSSLVAANASSKQPYLLLGWPGLMNCLKRKRLPTFHEGHPLWLPLLSSMTFTGTGIKSADRAQLERLCRFMGARFQPDLTDATTHLVSNREGLSSEKAKLMMATGKPVIRSEYIQHCWEREKRLNVEEYRLGVLSNAIVCATSFRLEEREEIKALVERNGGQWMTILSPSATHLIAKSDGQTKKRAYALRWQIPIVGLQWLHDCDQKKALVSVSLYPPPPSSMRGATPHSSDESESHGAVPPPVEPPITTEQRPLSETNGVAPSKTPATPDRFSYSPFKSNTLFKGKIFVPLNFEPIEVAEITQVIQAGGGKVTTAKKPRYISYFIAAHGILPEDIPDPHVPLVSTAFLQACNERKKIVDPADCDVFRPLPCPAPFASMSALTISLSGFQGEEKDNLVFTILVLGAKYTGNSFKKEHTHLISSSNNSRRALVARNWGIPVVSPAWLTACAVSGEKQPIDTFLLPAPDASAMAEENLPLPSQILTPRTAVLSGVVLCLTKAVQDRTKLVDLAESLGAEVLWTYTSRVTHLIHSGKVEKVKELEPAKARGLPVVSPLWLEECFAKSERLPERDFPSRVRGDLSLGVDVIKVGNSLAASSLSSSSSLPLSADSHVGTPPQSDETVDAPPKSLLDSSSSASKKNLKSPSSSSVVSLSGTKSSALDAAKKVSLPPANLSTPTKGSAAKRRLEEELSMFQDEARIELAEAEEKLQARSPAKPAKKQKADSVTLNGKTGTPVKSSPASIARHEEIEKLLSVASRLTTRATVPRNVVPSIPSPPSQPKKNLLPLSLSKRKSRSELESDDVNSVRELSTIRSGSELQLSVSTREDSMGSEDSIMESQTAVQITYDKDGEQRDMDALFGVSVRTTRRAGKSKPLKRVFILSGVREVEKAAMIEMITKLGGDVIGKSRETATIPWQEEVTHYCIGRATTSCKFFCALAAGAWVVTEKYLSDCVKNNKWLPEDNYWITSSSEGSQGTADLISAAPVWGEQIRKLSEKDSSRKHGAFEGWTVFMFVDPCETEVLVSIVKAGQGKVMQSFSEFLALLQRVGVNSPTVFALLSVDFLEAMKERYDDEIQQLLALGGTPPGNIFPTSYIVEHLRLQPVRRENIAVKMPLVRRKVISPRKRKK